MAQVPIGVRHRCRDLMPACFLKAEQYVVGQVDIDAQVAAMQSSRFRSYLELRCSLYSVRHATRVDPMIALPFE
jgi:hypothetical protein